MEKKIYRSLMLVSILTLIFTTITLSLLFYDFYIDLITSEMENIANVYINSNKNSLKGTKYIGKNIEINIYDEDSLPPKEKGFVVHNERLYEDTTLQVKRPVQLLEYIFIPSILIFLSLICFSFVFLHIVSSHLSNNLMQPIGLATESMKNILVNKVPNFNNIYPELHPFIANMNLYKENINYYISKLKENEVFRREFTANVSHELKTPLTSINGYAEMIKSRIAKEEDIPKLAGIIHEEGLRLLDMIESIIELSSLEEPNIDIEFSQIDLFYIVKDVAYKLQTRIIQKNIELNITGSNAFIEANERMVNDLIFNLLDNAIKYNKPFGSINIHTAPFNNKAVLVVEDTGIGIGDDKLDRVFERFYTVDKSRSSKNRSTGLGLSIVKHIVELHGGSISIESSLGKGTKIKIII